MARIRTVKPEMAQDEDLAECSIEAQLLAVRLLCHCDDEGYFKANAMLVKAACFPLSEYGSRKIHGMLSELSNAGYLKLFEGTDDKSYGLVSGFTRHQKVNRPSESKIKPKISNIQTFTDNSVNDHGELTPGKEQGTGKGTGNIETSDDVSPPDDKSPDAGDEVFLTIPLVDGTDHPITETEVAEYAELFPAVDVPQELRSCKAWNLGNPKNRKTPGGIRRHITSWLSRKQDQGGRNGNTYDGSRNRSNDQIPARSVRRYAEAAAELDRRQAEQRRHG